MQTMMAAPRLARAFWQDQSAISVTEYGLMIAGIVLLLMIVVQPTAGKIVTFFMKSLCTVTQQPC
jgi:Flp pilus assembly pilin Flp